MAILGDMKELGDATAEAHQAVINHIDTLSIGEVWLVGAAFAQTTHTQRTFTNVEEVIAALQAEQPTDRCILIKGSNSMKLFTLVPHL